MRSNLAISAAQLVCAASVLLVLAQCQDVFPRLELGGKVLANNSYIYRARIKQKDSKTLKCVTDNRFCCNNTSGNWYNEQEQDVKSMNVNNSSYYTIFGEGEIGLRHTKNGTVGTFRCDIPNFNGVMESLYIYIGTEKTGEGTLQSVAIFYHTHPRYQKLYQTPEFTLTCRSEGGPAMKVVWKRNGEPVQEDSNHTTSQTIVNTSVNSIYHNKLRVRGREGGWYSCNVSNNLPDYFSWLARLSYITSTRLRVEVAEKPTNLLSCWQSNTSLLVSWNIPSATPTGYVIYYMQINETDDHQYIEEMDYHSVYITCKNDTQENDDYDVDVCENGTYMLTNEEYCNYNISIVALSEHLPSAIVGFPIVSVADITPFVTVESTDKPVAGTPHTLNCTVIIPSRLMTVVPNIDWEGHGVGNGNKSTVMRGQDGYYQLLTFDLLFIAHGGEYVCTANYTLNSVTTRDGTYVTVLSVIIPKPSVSPISVVGNKTTYVGNNITLECTIQLNDVISDNDVEMNITWLRNGSVFTEQIQRVTTTPINISLTFVHLLESDRGRYKCNVTLIALKGNSPPQHNISSDYQLNTTVPSLIVQTVPQRIRILNVPPYNNFSVTCTAWAELEGKKVPLALSMDWIKRVECQTHSKLKFSKVANVHVVTDNNCTYMSTLKSDEIDTENSISYRCRASIKRDVDTRKLAFNNSHITVVGQKKPVLPQRIKVIDSNISSAMIQWMMSLIAYTNETYFVKYGTNSSVLNMTSHHKYSGANITISDKVYSVKLSNLQPCVTYYYRVVAKNTDRSTQSELKMFTTQGLLMIESSGDAVVGQPYTLTCTVECDITNHTSLTWEDSSGRTLEMADGTESRLELHFPLLSLSNISNYTCNISYHNGNSIQKTEDILEKVPVITVNISSSTQYLLDVPPYNRFMGSCVANVSVDGLEGPVELAIEWQWWRKGEGESELSKLPDNNFTNNESMSTLSYHEVINGSVMYWCVSILKGVDNISNYDNITVSVVGCRAPNTPEDVQAIEIYSYNVTIQWTVLLIAYTPETYVLEYGTRNDISCSEFLRSGDDIGAGNKIHSVQLHGLSPGTKYWYVVAVNNSCESKKTAPLCFYTNETAPGRVSFVEAMRVDNSSLYITWGPPQPANGNVTHYLVWVNSSSDQRLENTTARTLIVDGLTQNATYKVYVAAVNGAGPGEWNETTVAPAVVDTVISTTDASTATSTDASTATSTDASTATSTDASTATSTDASTATSTDASTATSTVISTGISSDISTVIVTEGLATDASISDESGPDESEAAVIGAAVTVILLLFIILGVLVIVLLLYMRKGEKWKPGEEMSPSSLLNYIMKDDGTEVEQFDSVEVAVAEEKGENEAAVMDKEGEEEASDGEAELMSTGPDTSVIDSMTAKARMMEEDGEKEASSGEEELIDAGAHSVEVNDTPEVVEEAEKREASGEDDEDVKGAEECTVDTTVESDGGEVSST